VRGNVFLYQGGPAAGESLKFHHVNLKWRGLTLLVLCTCMKSTLFEQRQPGLRLILIWVGLKDLVSGQDLNLACSCSDTTPLLGKSSLSHASLNYMLWSSILVPTLDFSGRRSPKLDVTDDRNYY
jgi:hypothetical protein